MTANIHYKAVLVNISACVMLAVVAGILSAHGYWYAITIAVAMLFVSPLFFHPALLLKLIVFLAPIYWIPFVPPELFELPQDILLVALFFIFIFSIASQKQQQYRLATSHVGLILLVLFILSLLIGVVFSSTPLESALLWLKGLQAVAFYAMLFYMVEDAETAKVLLCIFVAGQLVSVAYFWFEFLTAQIGLVPPWAIPYPNNFRGDGGLSFRRTAFSNTSAHILPVVLGLLLFNQAHRPHVTKLLLWLSFALVMGGIVLSRAVQDCLRL